MYECWYDNVNYMDTVSFIVYIKTGDIYNDIPKDVETTFGTSNLELDRPLLKGKRKKAIGLIKDELGAEVMIEFFELGAKTYSYLIDDGSQNKKIKSTKKVCHKKKT